jgi:uncharacterized membrane protein YqjE
MSDSNFGKMFVNTIVTAVAGRWISEIKTEVEIAKIELKVKGKELGKGAAMLLIAAVFAFFLVLVLLAAAIAGLSEGMPVWAASLIVAGVLLLWVLFLGIWGAYKVNKNKDLKPERAINNIKNSMPF